MKTSKAVKKWTGSSKPSRENAAEPAIFRYEYPTTVTPIYSSLELSTVDNHRRIRIVSKHTINSFAWVM